MQLREFLASSSRSGHRHDASVLSWALIWIARRRSLKTGIFSPPPPSRETSNRIAISGIPYTPDTLVTIRCFIGRIYFHYAGHPDDWFSIHPNWNRPVSPLSFIFFQSRHTHLLSIHFFLLVVRFTSVFILSVSLFLPLSGNDRRISWSNSWDNTVRVVKSDGLEIRLTRDGAIRGTEWQVFLSLLTIAWTNIVKCCG